MEDPPAAAGGNKTCPQFTDDRLRIPRETVCLEKTSEAKLEWPMQDIL